MKENMYAYTSNKNYKKSKKTKKKKKKDVFACWCKQAFLEMFCFNSDVLTGCPELASVQKSVWA